MTAGLARDDEALRAAKALIARAVLADAESETLGSVRLRPAQRLAIRQLRNTLAAHGGALLADEVGLGKTFVALGLARGYASVVVVAPAVLARMWDHALMAAGIRAARVSTEALSRDADLPATDLVIVDEAHHFRNAGTRRYRRLAAGCASAHLLLLSATPVHNASRDLRSLLALFLGHRARTLAIEELGRFVLRRGVGKDDGALPAVAGPLAVSLPDDARTLAHIARMPPAVPVHDGGTAAALGELALVHRWASSRAALVTSLGARRARAAALDDALAAGRHPTRQELGAWLAGDGAVQLGFPTLLAAHSPPAEASMLTREHLRRHEEAIVNLLAHLADSPDPDTERAARLLEIRRRHAGARVVAFSQYAATVTALGRVLARVPGVATLTAAGGRIASGSIGREEVLAQFGPEAIEPPAHRRIDLLLATDLLSEGVNLQGASVMVHLDLPWNPARLDQRVGRLRRMGSRHAVVSVYLFVPPASAERLLALERRLRDKISIAASVVAPALVLLPGAGPMIATSEAAQRQRAMRIVADWPTAPAFPAAIGAVCGDLDAALALVGTRDGNGLLAIGADGLVTEDAGVVADLLARIATGCAVRVPPAREAAARRAIATWVSAREAGEAVAGTAGDDVIRRQAFARVARTVQAAPRHRRAAVESLAAAARRRLDAPLPAGAEFALESLVDSPGDDERWMHAVATLPARAAPPVATTGMLALILLVRGQSSSAGV